MTHQQEFDLWCQAFGYDPSRDSRGEIRNHTARLLWEAYLRGAWDEYQGCVEQTLDYANRLKECRSFGITEKEVGRVELCAEYLAERWEAEQ